MFQSVVKIAINTTNKDLIEEGKKILSLIKLSDDTFEELKELASNGNKDAEDLLKNLNSSGQNMINNLI
jgi:predicted DNA-binding antitoxin AbrB/MazE fold protein